MKKEEIYLNLDEYTRSEVNEVLSIIENQKIDAVDNIDYFPYTYNTLKFTGEEWFVTTEFSISDRTEVTFTEFKQLCSEWGYLDALPKPLTEIEKECLEMIEKLMPYIPMENLDTYNMYLEAFELTQKLKSYETI